MYSAARDPHRFSGLMAIWHQNVKTNKNSELPNFKGGEVGMYLQADYIHIVSEEKFARYF